MHVFYVSAAGDVIRIFPNVHHPQSRVTGGQIYKIPPPRAKFALEVDCDARCGQELVHVIAASKPLPVGTWTKLGGGLRGYRGIRIRRLLDKYRIGRRLAEQTIPLLSLR